MSEIKNSKFKFGFTLAEVLITLVIIGVIAAMTIPNVIATYQEQEKKARIKKTYATLSGAFMRSKADNGDYYIDNLNEDSTSEWFDIFLKPYLSTLKICYGTAGCWKGKTQFLKGGDCHYAAADGIGSPRVTTILSDGTFVNFDVYNNPDINEKYRVNLGDGFSVVAIFDINGAKSPNTFGKDTFAVVYTPDGFVPSFRDANESQISSDCSKTGTGYSCIMNYIK